MRMVCDSTYIIDQETRHDTKVEELMNILEEYFDSDAEKVVVFSQWERMTRLVARELEVRSIGYRYLHGGVPGRDRKALFDHFNGDPQCRVFLSTDAGSTGLNLQTASMVINLDIPWNPAVMEQRIGRVHRYGQKNKVQVINLVSTGTIEHRMIAVLQFKTSLFDGILNDGEDSIFMGEDKFRQFMKTVETITLPEETLDVPVAQPLLDIEEESAELGVPPEEIQDNIDAESTSVIIIPGDDHVVTTDRKETPDQTTITETSETMAIPEPTELITKGLGFLSGLAQTFSSPEATHKLVSSLVDKDPQSGKTYLKIPVENEKSVSDVLHLMGQLFMAFRK
jgi:superfamily II DNA/RNA helicase